MYTHNTIMFNHFLWQTFAFHDFLVTNRSEFLIVVRNEANAFYKQNLLFSRKKFQTFAYYTVSNSCQCLAYHFTGHFLFPCGKIRKLFQNFHKNMHKIFTEITRIFTISEIVERNSCLLESIG